MNNDQILRQHLLSLLRGRDAHMSFWDAVADFPDKFINVRPTNVPYTFWHLIEHVRIAQWDILEYVRNPAHVSPPWPEGHWPAPDAQADRKQWNETIRLFDADMQALEAIVRDPATDLYSPIPHGYGGHTILREVLLVADHNAYHTGELGILRQVMNAWPK
jgi:hypothetical protein